MEVKIQNGLKPVSWWRHYVNFLKFFRMSRINYRVCHEFKLTKRDDYFWVVFDHSWSKHHFWGNWGSIKNGSSLKPSNHFQVKFVQIRDRFVRKALEQACTTYGPMIKWGFRKKAFNFVCIVKTYKFSSWLFVWSQSSLWMGKNVSILVLGYMFRTWKEMIK